MTNEQRITAFSKLGEFIRQPDASVERLIYRSQHENAWFTPDQVTASLNAIAFMLNRADLDEWFKADVGVATNEPKTVGLVLAGNIPLVGFHDVLCVLATGNRALIKLSSQDRHLLPFMLDKLTEIEPGFAGSFGYTERLAGFDAVIATGSGNTSRYFDYYFSKVPHIIRRNRNSVAVLSGDESDSELLALGADIFSYFGLGCRNVSKIFAPKGYRFDRFFEVIEAYRSVADHHKYSNNYDYNKSILLVNGDAHLDNGFLLLKPDDRTASPLAVVYTEEYVDRSALGERLAAMADDLQCVIGQSPGTVKFGQGQFPRLWDYADNVNTPRFLRNIGR